MLYFLQNRFPTCKLISSCSGETIFKSTDRFGCIYKYINGKHPPYYELPTTLADYLGEQLAILHLELSRFPSMRDIIVDKRLNRDQTKKELENVLNNNTKENTHIENYIKWQANLLKVANKIDKTLPKQIIHGDYYSDNIFISTNSKKLELIALIDWEFSGFQLRSYEVVYSANFLSLVNSNSTPYNLDVFQAFIQAYHRTNPLSEQELDSMQNILIEHWINSTWILKADYLETEKRIRLLSENRKIINWLLSNNDISKLCGKVT